MPEITKPQLATLRAAITAALASVHIDGLSINLGNCSYTTSSATFKLEVKTVAANGLLVGKEAEAFKVNAHSYGLDAGDLFKEILVGGRPFVLTGLNPRASKQPFQVKEKATGKSFKVSPYSVIAALQGSEAALFFQTHGYPQAWEKKPA